MMFASTKSVNENTRFAVALALLALVILAWIGGTIGTVVYAAQPGNAGAVVGVFLVAAVGWGFVQEAWQHLGEC